jgi:hypothetical protein
MWNGILFFLGGMSIVGGILAFPLPFPLGLPLVIMGVTLLIRASPRTRAYVYYLAERYPKYFQYFKNLDRNNDDKDKSE